MKYEEEEKKIVLITGASSGLGMMLAFEFVKTQDYITYASMRDLQSSQLMFQNNMREDFDESGVCLTNEEIDELLKYVQLDVTDMNSCLEAVNFIILKEGRIDILINNAGIALVGFTETVTIEQTQKLFDINFFGAIRVMQAVLPHMRMRRCGHVITISSISAISAPNGLGLYGASKKALEAIHESDAPMLESVWNIKMTLIEPGNVLTTTEHLVHKTMIGEREDYTQSLQDVDGKKYDPYKQYIEKSLGIYKIMLPFSSDSSQDVAKLIIEEVIENEERKGYRFQIGEDSKTLSTEVWKNPDGQNTFETEKTILEMIL